MTPLDSLNAFAYVTHVYGNNWYVARKSFLNDVRGPLVQGSKKYYIASIKPSPIVMVIFQIRFTIRSTENLTPLGAKGAARRSQARAMESLKPLWSAGG